MLNRIADGVYVHVSEFLQSNGVVVQGRDGVLVIDPGITRAELTCLAADLRELGLPVVAGFSTHADWDHVLWHASFGGVPRHGTPRAAAYIADVLSHADWRDEISEGLPPEHADEVPMELLGLITPLAGDVVPWDGPPVRVVEHQGHAPGHAALVVEEARVLVAGDMVSDILMPFLDLQADDPIGDYLASLSMLGELVDAVDIVVPGHGSVGDAAALTERLAQDRAYVEAVRDGRDVEDARVGPDAVLEWLPDVHAFQVERLVARGAVGS